MSVSHASPALRARYNDRPWSWRGNGPDAGGEYLAAAFLNDGSMAAVIPIQNDLNNRLGFGRLRRGSRLEYRARRAAPRLPDAN